MGQPGGGGVCPSVTVRYGGGGGGYSGERYIAPICYLYSGVIPSLGINPLLLVVKITCSEINWASPITKSLYIFCMGKS